MSSKRAAMLRVLASMEHRWDAGVKWAQMFRRQILIVAAVFVVIGLVMTIRTHPEIIENLSWGSVALLALFITPILILMGAIEFVVMAACLAASVPLARALFVTVIGTAMNLMPVPGAILTRIAALKAAGASARSGARLILLQGLLWLATTMMLGGVAIIFAGFHFAGSLLAAGGFILEVIVVTLLLAQGFRRLEIIKLASIRFFLVLLDGVRIAFALEAIGADIFLYQAIIFTLASSFGSALSIIPVGFGVRELISAALAPLAGIPMALGFAAAVLIRVIDLIIVFLLATALAIQDKLASRKGL